MPAGDFNWASRELTEHLGSRWTNDRMGHVTLYNAYYQPRMSSDLRERYQEAFQVYIERKYGFDFDDNFDWDTYRRHYRAAH